MVWAGITAHRRTDLVFVNGTLNAQKYRQDILERHVVPFIRANGVTLQQDNASPTRCTGQYELSEAQYH